MEKATIESEPKGGWSIAQMIFAGGAVFGCISWLLLTLRAAAHYQ